MKRHAAYANLSKSERLILDRNEKLKEGFLGEEDEPLDPAQQYVLRMFWLLRRTVPSDRGIPLSLRDIQELDESVLELLLVADSAYLEEQVKKMDSARRKDVTAPAPPRKRGT